MAFMNPVGTGPPGLQEPADNDRDQEKHDGGDQPQHEHVFRHGKVDAGDGREMDQRMVDRAVGNVLDDRVARR